MNNAVLLTALLLPLVAPAEEPGKPAQAPGTPKLVVIDKKDISLEDLAHTFFFHSGSREVLQNIISEEGINRLEPELAELRREMIDLRKIAPKGRQMCSDLQKAKSGQEFAAVFIESERQQQNERQEQAKRILAKLDAADRKALERYLDTEFRNTSGRASIDYEATYTSGPFPSAQTSMVMQRTCDSAAEMEARVEP